MTVCIAAICEGHTVFGASDRMITGGDIEFEAVNPSVDPSKITMLTSSIAAMVAGDVGLQREILSEVAKVVAERVTKEPKNWWLVKEVAELYVTIYDRIRVKRARSEILAPYGLDEVTFIQRQKEMSEGFIERVRKELIGFSLPNVETIIAGVDNEGGPHIYVLSRNYLICSDPVGFAAIGSGRRHAESQFMLVGHEPKARDAETLYLTYLAKKRSEKAPGVGRFTDMVGIGPRIGSASYIRRAIIDRLDHIYERYVKSEAVTWERAKDSVTQYAEELKRVSQAEGEKGQQAPSSSS